MSQDTKIIRVNFIKDKIMEPDVWYMGKISLKQLVKLMSLVDNIYGQRYKPKDSDCIKRMSLTCNLFTYFGEMQTRCTDMFGSYWDGPERTYTLELRPFWNYNGNNTTACGIQKLASSSIQQCAHNLRCGKCRDEFICRTLGTTLFPEKYSKQKQK